MGRVPNIQGSNGTFAGAKPVKAIAYDLGFDDEFHFSRYFKNHTDVSPQLYRDTVGAGWLKKCKLPAHISRRFNAF
jgi:AraC-like DNA-binding protein